MQKTAWPAVWGTLLVMFGVLSLLHATGVLTLGGTVWAVVFLLASAAFLGGYLLDRAFAWASIPAGALGGIGALLLWGTLRGDREEPWGVTIFLGMLGLGFAGVYLRDRTNWWAIIPGGVITTIAVFIGVAEMLGGNAVMVVFFIGLAATFALLSLVETPAGRQRWPLIPAAILGFIALLFALGATSVLGWLNSLWAVAIVIFGLYLIVHTIRDRGRHGPAT